MTEHESMVPPPGYTFIFSSQACDVVGCFECIKIHCDKCDMKDRLNLELERKNRELVKYIEKLQHRLLDHPAESPLEFGSGQYGFSYAGTGQLGSVGSTKEGKIGKVVEGTPPQIELDRAFAYIKSPVLFDPNLNRMYTALTLFIPADV
ncbi:hypothetical protein GNI_151380 [Gregarina niphandrodes]|uniref:Uncharacterized protein n=1 Tax=Gregarina niphandrodes TaxID=110365 RepID=A0A023B0E8_GRENI|nr:hypothetical protein GNI_151380 [Gregarina niphandrodes]EZG44159.1 hypothetical protein GNI_151380 [Gregarina niphandrodes]|eukprot:XP_011132783.1 hypothetical protein GNI_151380 [Gregarina niphandrodes]